MIGSLAETNYLVQDIYLATDTSGYAFTVGVRMASTNPSCQVLFCAAGSCDVQSTSAISSSTWNILSVVTPAGTIVAGEYEILIQLDACANDLFVDNVQISNGP
jgi:hypothetical protein